MTEENEVTALAHVGKRKWGYDPDQVDEFLSRAHALYESDDINMTLSDLLNVSFELRKGGYDIQQVDAALDRLQRAVVDKNTTHEIAEHGRVAWKAQLEELFRQIEAHAARENGERFAPAQPKAPAYDRKQVDHIVDQILQTASQELLNDSIDDPSASIIAKNNGEQSERNTTANKDQRMLDAQTVANTVFTQRKGKRGYDERQVDYYLSSCIELLSRLESYGRIESFVTNTTAAQVPASQEETSLFANAQTPVVTPVEENHVNSFDELQKAETAIFDAPVTSPVQLSSHVESSEPTVGTQTQVIEPIVDPIEQSAQTVQAVQPAQTQPAQTSIESTQSFDPLAYVEERNQPEVMFEESDSFVSPAQEQTDPLIDESIVPAVDAPASDNTEEKTEVDSSTDSAMFSVAMPQVPQLNISIPDLPMPAGAHTSVESDLAHDDSHDSVDIPDLSFPSISHDDSKNE